MPNYFAYVALLLWPLLSLKFFRKYDTITAVFYTIVGAHMFLPVRAVFDLPLIRPLDKESIPVLCAVIYSIYVKGHKFFYLPKNGVEKLLVIALVLLPFATYLSNQEAYHNGEKWIAGLTFKDGISFSLDQYIELLPFILGIQLLKKKEDVLTLFKLFMSAGLLYSLFILFEARMSPQLNNWIYGFTNSWVQQIRMGGFRPTVFMGHGLWVATFLTIAFMSTLALWKEKAIVPIAYRPIFLLLVYMVFILWLCKTVGAYILAISFAIIIFSKTLRERYVIIKVILLITVSYPLLSITDLFPHEKVVEKVAEINIERAQSLNFRFYHEGRLLEHANTKPLFGWGGWGRNRLHDSITDGYWIIVYGIKGAAGFLGVFGLLSLSILVGLKASLSDPDNKFIMICFSLMATLLVVDQVPNASISAYIWFLFGGLLGVSRSLLLANNTGQRLVYTGR